MPDTSAFGQLARRVRADLPALRARFASRSVLVPLFAGVALIGGGYFARRWWLSRR